MKQSLLLKSILIYGEKNNKYFYTEFGQKINILYGKNTAGKSTALLLILYAFGINDNKIKLTEVLTEEIIIRLDCSISSDNGVDNYVFVRQDDTLFIREPNGRIIRFNGIGADNSREHIKLKKYFRKLFNFNLRLESNSGIADAPIETLFLPYYVSQDVGWVYLRKSFANLNFYKNFKDDFIDYYLGIENAVDREKKRELEVHASRLRQVIKFYLSMETERSEFKVSRLLDESFSGKANEMLEIMSQHKNKLLDVEKKYLNKCNELTYFSQRLSVLSRVKKNHKKQLPGRDSCPTCAQTLPETTSGIYEYYQDENDTTSLGSQLKIDINRTQAKINSLQFALDSLKKEININNVIYCKYTEKDITLRNWIDGKAKVQLHDNLVTNIGKSKVELQKTMELLKEFKTDKEITVERQRKSSIFKSIYLGNNRSLGLPKLEEPRFSNLYDISSFPFQGVQLHLAVLSYHFAFNRLLTQSSDIHRLPFMLDSVLKEDLDGASKEKILNFIYSNSPRDTQTILSLADDKEVDSKINHYSESIFTDNTKLICIGDGIKEKALLKPNDGLKDDLLQNTYEILQTV